jgi:hypothetical protein
MGRTARATRLLAVAALASFVVPAMGATRAHAITLTSAGFAAGTLTTKWNLDSGDCAGSVSISDTRDVDAYGFFAGWHLAWGGGNCLATSNVRSLGERAGTYYLQGHALPPAPYYMQIQYCHDSDFSGNYFCRASNPLRVRIPGAVAGTLSHLTGRVLVAGGRARTGTTIKYGDEVTTYPAASATVDLAGGSVLTLGGSSTLIPRSPARARIRSGTVVASLDRSFRISSPNAAATVPAGVFKLAVSRHWTRDRTHDGSVAFSNTRGTRTTVNVEKGYQSTVRGSNPPTVPRRF